MFFFFQQTTTRRESQWKWTLKLEAEEEKKHVVSLFDLFFCCVRVSKNSNEIVEFDSCFLLAVEFCAYISSNLNNCIFLNSYPKILIK